MREKTKAYMAGLMDGEGCFSIFKTFKSNYVNYRPFVGFTNGSKALMQWAVNHFVGTINYQKAAMNGGYLSKPLYHWRLYGRKSVGFFLTSISPYLIEKRQQANILLEYLNLDGQINPVKRDELFVKLREAKKSSCVTTETPGALVGKPLQAYLAAILDGEGYLVISRGPAYNVRIGITNTFMPLLELAKNKFGGSISPLKNKKGKPAFVWYISKKQDIEKYLLALLPYLIVKRDEGKILLNYVRHNKPTPEIREDFYQQMKAAKDKRAKIQSGLMSDHERALTGTLVA